MTIHVALHQYDRNRLKVKTLPLRLTTPLHEIYFIGDVVENLNEPFNRFVIKDIFVRVEFNYNGNEKTYESQRNNVENNFIRLSINGMNNYSEIILYKRSFKNWIKYFLVLLTKHYKQ